MSNNYYAKWEVAEGVEITLHIGKDITDDFIFAGDTFPTYSVWVEFLTHNEEIVQIVDEMGNHFYLNEMINIIENTDDRGRQHQWYLDNMPDHIDNENRGKDKVWVDPDGFNFAGGVFT